MKGQSTYTNGSCGLGTVYNFDRVQNDTYDDHHGFFDLAEIQHRGGSRYLLVAYVDSKRCKEAFKIFNGRFKTVYQSDVRLNTSSENLFFFVIYDTTPDDEQPVDFVGEPFNATWL